MLASLENWSTKFLGRKFTTVYLEVTIWLPTNSLSFVSPSLT